jgi:DNA-binding transcriptional MerR regulator
MMFNPLRSQQTNNPPTEGARGPQADSQAPSSTFSLDEVTSLLQVSPERLRQWGQVYPLFLDEAAKARPPRYTQADLATLIVIQKMLEAGHDHEQIVQRLQHHPTASAHSDTAEKTTQNPNPTHSENLSQNSSHSARQAAFSTERADVEPALDPTDSAGPAANNASPLSRPEPAAPANPPALHPRRSGDALGDLLQTVADSQQSMLNVQDSIREMLGVIVQDNFNLKHENRKLRDRMLELERTLAEYQRREETRKERLEGRLRAVESTLGAIQQQVAQLVQLYRQRKPRGWFR